MVARQVIAWCKVNRRAWLVVVTLMLAAALPILSGCGINVGATQEVSIDEPSGSGEVSDLEISMGAGRLTLGPGAQGLVAGTVRYNVEDWKPAVERGDSSVTIKQGKGFSLGSGMINEWNLELGATPMHLAVNAGAYEGTYELGGLPIRSLSIKDGASKVQVAFGSPNPELMERFTYDTGASSVTISGLGNANCREMEFTGGAGSYDLNFSGDLRQAASVRIETGVGSIRVVVPTTTSARVTVEGALRDVDSEGPWAQSGDTYSTPAAAQGQVLLSITVDVSVGALDLVTQ